MTFDPNGYISKIKGKDYLEVKWRIVWFRDQHPNGRIETELVSMEPLLMRATVTNNEGAVLSTGYGSAQVVPNAVWSGREVEKAETAAIGRALAHAGFGTQFTGEVEGDHLADAPAPPKPNGRTRAAAGSPLERRQQKIENNRPGAGDAVDSHILKATVTGRKEWMPSWVEGQFTLETAHGTVWADMPAIHERFFAAGHIAETDLSELEQSMTFDPPVPCTLTGVDTGKGGRWTLGEISDHPDKPAAPPAPEPAQRPESHVGQPAPVDEARRLAAELGFPDERVIEALRTPKFGFGLRVIEAAEAQGAIIAAHHEYNPRDITKAAQTKAYDPAAVGKAMEFCGLVKAQAETAVTA